MKVGNMFKFMFRYLAGVMGIVFVILGALGEIPTAGISTILVIGGMALIVWAFTGKWRKLLLF